MNVNVKQSPEHPVDKNNSLFDGKKCKFRSRIDHYFPTRLVFKASSQMFLTINKGPEFIFYGLLQNLTEADKREEISDELKKFSFRQSTGFCVSGDFLRPGLV